MTLLVLGIYLAMVLSIGLASHRLFRGTGEDYFLATRSIGPFVLLMSIFGTHMTAFSMLGASGEAYRRGIGVFGLMASAAAVVVPVVIFFLGTRLWALGKRLGVLTQVQLFRARWGSDRLGLLLFVVLVALVVPYLLIGVLGAGLTLSQITGGEVPPWVGGLLLSGVVMLYVTFGGLRGTAWVNTFQTLVFMVLGAITVVFIVDQLGGLAPALERLQEARPDLLSRGDAEGGDKIAKLYFMTYLLIPLSIGMFPHMFQHWLSARSAESFKLPMIAYPFCVAIVWLPSVLLGIFGHLDFPDLQGPEASSILIRLIHLHAPEVLAGLLGAGVFAAVMSSLDSQVLALGTMFTQDVVRHYRFDDQMDEKRQVLVGRLFVAGMLVITYLLSLVANTTIFGLAVWSFTGFSGLFPIVLAALFWRRSTATGAAASVLTTAALWIYFFSDGFAVPGYSAWGTGLPPVAVILPLSALAMVAGSLATNPPDEKTLRRFFPHG